MTSPTPFEPPAGPPDEFLFTLQHDGEAWTAPAAEGPRWWLAAGLFAVTFVLCTTFGVFWSLATRTDLSTGLFFWGPLFTWDTFVQVWSDPRLLRLGLSFSVPALTILGCHEMGHYLACRHYRVPSTLPYFLPFPAGFGTLGAFIKIKAPIRRKKALFDIGIAGPLAGFVVLVPVLLVGIALSTPTPLPPPASDSQALAMLFLPGRSLAIELVSRLFHGPLPAGWGLNLHPFAMAAWFGLFATSLNLIPLGQLDGGHVLYATLGPLQRRLALPLWIGLAALSFLWFGWAVWAGITLFLGLRHPPVADESAPLDGKRRALALLALVILVLSFIPRPIEQRVVHGDPMAPFEQTQPAPVR
jgi:membrane-associated protease RseP (regulator of RpoE activity)